MKITKLISNEQEYNEVVKRIDELFHAVPGTADGNEVELLILLVRQYDLINYPIPEPDPVEYLKFIMEQKSLKQKDLVEYLGNRGAVSKILNRKRSLTLEMIKNLKRGLGLSADALIN